MATLSICAFQRGVPRRCFSGTPKPGHKFEPAVLAAFAAIGLVYLSKYYYLHQYLVRDKDKKES